MSCSRTKGSDSGEALTCSPSVSSQALYHWATALPILEVKNTWNGAQYPLHHVTYATAKFEVATSNSLGKDVFTRKYSIWTWIGHQGHLKYCSTLYIMWPRHLQRLQLQQYRSRYIYKKMLIWPWPGALYPLHHVTYAV